MARTDDFEWLLGLLPQAEPDLQNKIAILAGAVFNVMDPHQFDLAFKSAERYQLLAEQLQGYWRAIDIDSERARTLREHCQRQREFRNRTAGGKPPTQSRTIEEQVSAQLDSFDAGNFDAWWGVVQLLQTNPQERVRLIHNNLKAAPVWEQLNETTQRRILAAARVYLEKGDPHTDEWFGKDRIFYSMVAGYSALFLLSPNRKWTLKASQFRCGNDGQRASCAPLQSQTRRRISNVPSALMLTPRPLRR